MNQLFEDFEEIEVPTEDSDKVKSVKLSISHQHNNVLINSKGKVRQEDFFEFGIQTAPDNHIEDIE